MNLELLNIVNKIKEKTGIDVAIFDSNKKLCVSTCNGFENVVFPKKIGETYSCTQTNKTYFEVKYNGVKYIAVLIGASSESANYAYLIKKLIENASSKDSALSQTENVRSILLGESTPSQIQNYVARYSVPSNPCFVLVVKTENAKKEDVVNLLKNFATGKSDSVINMDNGFFAFIKFVDLNEYQSSTDYAEALYQSLYEELGEKSIVTVGSTVKGFEEIAVSYMQAMTTLRMAKALGSKGDVHAFNEYILVKMIEDVPKAKLSEYLSMLLSKEAEELFTDEDMISTAEEFLENSLNVSETSRNLYLHRNTLMYRLDKIEKATGLNIRKFSDAVTFRLITLLYKLVK